MQSDSQHIQQDPCLQQEHQQHERLHRSFTAKPQLHAEGYGTDQVVPRQRQQGDVDAKADYGQVAEEQPGQNLERLEGPRPAVHPRRLGKDQLGPDAAVHGRRPSQPLTAAAHLEGSRGRFTSSQGHIC